MAIISADATPMQKELRAVERMAAQAGKNMRSSLEGGHSGKSGAIRETMVLMREMSRGNWSRVPGSLSILLSQLGILNLFLGKGATASRILADAWEMQAQKAGVAAVAATRKAAASLMAFEADESETGATLEAAVADELKAGASILNAKATQAKAVASGEAAAAAEAEAGATVASFAPIAAALAVVAIAALVVYERFWGVRKALEGMTMPDLKMDYVPKMLRGTEQALAAQKKITDEVKKTIEAYNGAAGAAGRVEKVSKAHFDHLRKMNEFEKDPKKKAARELELNSQERGAELINKSTEKANLEIESKRKSREAAAIKVKTEAEDAQTRKMLDQNAEAAELFLKNKGGTWDSIKSEAAARFGGSGTKYDERVATIDAAQSMNDEQAQNSINARNKFADKEQENKVKREAKAEAEKAASAAAAAAAKIGLEIPDIVKANKQRDSDEAEEEAARLKSQHGKTAHGSVNELQRVGAYTTPAVTDIAKSSLHELKGIRSELKRLGTHKGPIGAVKF